MQMNRRKLGWTKRTQKSFEGMWPQVAGLSCSQWQPQQAHFSGLYKRFTTPKTLQALQMAQQQVTTAFKSQHRDTNSPTCYNTSPSPKRQWSHRKKRGGGGGGDDTNETRTLSVPICSKTNKKLLLRFKAWLVPSKAELMLSYSTCSRPKATKRRQLQQGKAKTEHLVGTALSGRLNRNKSELSSWSKCENPGGHHSDKATVWEQMQMPQASTHSQKQKTKSLASKHTLNTEMQHAWNSAGGFYDCLLELSLHALLQL